jgi:dienelactone hydrolase
MVFDGQLKFALHVAIYPLCMVHYDDPRSTNVPIRVLIGAKDNRTPASHCLELAAQLQSEKVDFKVTTYPGAYHGFDGGHSVRIISNSNNLTNCRFRYNSDGMAVELGSNIVLKTNADVKKALSACATQGTFTGRNSSAATMAMRDLKRIVNRYLRSPP